MGAFYFSFRVSFLCFLIFREEFGVIIDVDEWPGEIFSASDGFEPREFSWKSFY